METLNPILLAFLAGLFTYATTALGSAMVFFFKSINKTILNTMLGFAAGIMVSASFFSLILPAIEMSNENLPKFLPVSVGFFLGGLVLFLLDKLLPHLHIESGRREGMSGTFKKSVLLIAAITIHNLPEGFAVGVAFGGIHNDPSLFWAAITLMIGMGLQNIPEGAAVSIPLRRENYTRARSFFYGQLSGVVEPIGAVLGAASVYFISFILPYALSFAAGAMLYVVSDELIPESQIGVSGESDFATIGFMGGFLIMMILDLML